MKFEEASEIRCSNNKPTSIAQKSAIKASSAFRDYFFGGPRFEGNDGVSGGSDDSERSARGIAFSI